MAKYDIEKFLTQLQTFLQANLTAKLAAIDSDKNDGITLAVPASAAYFFQTMNDKEAAYDPYLWFGVVDIKTVAIKGAAGKTYLVNVMIILSDPGNDANISKRMLRYLRALEELITENFAGVRADMPMEVNSLVPVPVTDLNTGAVSRVTGVEIQIRMF